MRFTRPTLASTALAFSAMVLTAWAVSQLTIDASVSIAFLGFIGKAVGAVGKVAGGILGLGKDAGKGASADALAASNKALADALAAKSTEQKTGLRAVPTWVWIAGGAVILAVGGFLVFRRRR